MRTLQKITTEKELNEVLKHRRDKTFAVLYHSLWDDRCQAIVKLAEEWQKKEGNETVYLVNSWDLPASFASFSISNAPSLVHLSNRKVKVDVEFPTIHNYFTDSRRASRPKRT